MYTPTGCTTLAEATQAQIRLGIQGFAGTSKTWAALTFPNPLCLNYDRGLGAHLGRSDVIEVPMWDPLYVRKFAANGDVKEATDIWLTKEAPKLDKEQTLIIDGGTTIQKAYHKWYSKNPVYTKSGKEDDFAEWGLKLIWFGDIMDILKSLKCNVIWLSHEAEKKEKNGEYIGKIRPLLSGSFGDQLVSHFTDWFRSHAGNKPKEGSPPDKAALAKWGMSDTKQFTEMCNTFPCDTIYFWQTASDDNADCKVSSLVECPKFIPANWQSFQKYMRKTKIST